MRVERAVSLHSHETHHPFRSTSDPYANLFAIERERVHDVMGEQSRGKRKQAALLGVLSQVRGPVYQAMPFTCSIDLNTITYVLAVLLLTTFLSAGYYFNDRV